MLNRVVKAVFIVGAALQIAPSPTLAQVAKKEKKYKDRAEYDIFNGATKEADPAKQLQLLQTWKDKYPDSDFKEERAIMVAQDYAKLGKAAEAVKASQDVLAINPKNLTALVTIVTNAIRVAPPTPDSLSAGEQAANTLTTDLDSFKPAGVKDADWNAAKGQIEQLAQTTLGWVKMQQKQNDAAEAAFRKVLEINPKNGQVSFWLGTVMYAQKKYVPGLFEFARAAVYSGDGALPESERQKADQFLGRAYAGYHGSNDGLDDLKKAAAASALPPADLKIASITDISQGQAAAEEDFLKAHPDIKFWRTFLRDALKADGGEKYFNDSVKDALIPPQTGDFKQFKAKVVSMENPKEIVVSVDDADGPNGDATLVFETPIKTKLDPGAELEFAGAPESYTKDPFSITFKVDRANVTGLPKETPARRSAPTRKK